MRYILAVLLLSSTATAVDLTHYSSAFNETRNYRLFLPSDYETASSKRYPVVYFFHGWGERYNVSTKEVGDYDFGYNGDNLSAYAASHDLIIVKVDGYNPRYPGEPRRRPWNLCFYDAPPSECTAGDTPRDFAAYFLELVGFIDATYRTIPDRDHRATSGISMGGFLSYYLAAKYPDKIGSASNFMGSHEFLVGETEWSPMYVYANYEGQRTRMITGSRDFIRWYHRQMQALWSKVRTNHEVEDFDSTHGTPGMAKTLDFHMRAFSDPLPKPPVWTHTDIDPSFQVWGYSVTTDRTGPGFTTLENVSPKGFNWSVREFLPNGRLLPQVKVTITTDALYTPGSSHDLVINDKTVTKTADASGRLTLNLTGGGAQGTRSKPRGPKLGGVMISDGQTRTVWHHATEQVPMKMGTGNGDGFLNPGESFAVQLLDKGAYRAGEVLAADSCLDLSQPPIRDQWASYDHVGASRKYTIVTANCKPGQTVRLFVNFTLPNAPEHIVRQGVVKLKVATSRSRTEP